MKTLLYLICLLIAASLATAQDIDTVRHRTHTFVVKLAPLSLLDPDATIQGGLEYFIQPRLSLQIEAGYGPPALRVGGFGPTPWTENSHVNRKSTGRLRAEVRHYWPFSGFYLPAQYATCGVYLGLEALYKQVNVMELDTVQGGETADIVFVQAPITRHIVAVHGKIGSQIKFTYNPGTVWSRFVIDYYIGLGVRHVSVVENGDETRTLFQDKMVYDRFQYSIYQPGRAFWKASAAAGIKIGFTF